MKGNEKEERLEWQEDACSRFLTRKGVDYQMEARMAFAAARLEKLGFRPEWNWEDFCLEFLFKGEPVRYSCRDGHAVGKSIRECTGLDCLIEQLK